MKILVIEDDHTLQKSICAGLRKFGYATDTASDGEEALQLYETNQYDAIVLDLNLPKIDGMDVLRDIRMADQQIKVLILSARSEVDDKIMGLDYGANDYMEKPFHIRELEARLRALMRRQFIQTDKMLVHGNLLLDTALKSVHVGQIQVRLTKKEYGILEYLAMHKEKVVPAEEIIEHVWDSDTDLFSNSLLKVHINSLKKKLSVCLGNHEIIKNMRGVGYYLAEGAHENHE